MTILQSIYEFIKEIKPGLDIKLFTNKQQVIFIAYSPTIRGKGIKFNISQLNNIITISRRDHEKLSIDVSNPELIDSIIKYIDRHCREYLNMDDWS